MKQEQRVLLFIMVTFVILMASQFFMPTPPPSAPKPTPAAGERAEADATPAEPPSDRVEEFQTEAEDERQTTFDDALEAGEERFVVRTRDFEVEFTSRGARPVRWDIVAPELAVNACDESKTVEPISMIPHYAADNPDGDLPLQVTFKERDSFRGFPRLNKVNYACERTTDAEGATIVRCVSPVINDVRLTKTYRLPWDSYLIDVTVELENLSDSPRPRRITDGVHGFGLSWGPGIGQYAEEASRMSDVHYISMAVASEREVRNIKPDDESRTVGTPSQWIAIKNKYFLVCLIREGDEPFAAARFLQRDRNRPPKELEDTQSPPQTFIAYTEPLDIPPGGSTELEYRLFVGPMKRALLKKSGHDLSRLLFYESWNWFRALKLGLMALLDWLYKWVGNYGVAIILLTFIVRIVTHPLTHHSMKLNSKTQLEMAKVRPEIEEINKKHKEDFQARNKATMEVYKKHGINPMAPLRGCVPMLVQLPIFFALYRLLDTTVELRGAPFLWICDLSQADRLFSLPFALPLLGDEFNLLPLLMALTTVLTQLLSSTQITDPNQKMMLYMMPILLFFMLYHLSAGLFVYWITSNIWQAIHQAVTTRLLKRQTPGTPPVPAGGGGGKAG